MSKKIDIAMYEQIADPMATPRIAHAPVELDALTETITTLQDAAERLDADYLTITYKANLNEDISSQMHLRVYPSGMFGMLMHVEEGADADGLITYASEGMQLPTDEPEKAYPY